MGSKFLQDYYDMSVGRADTLVLLPEGAIVVIALPLGILLDRLNLSTRTKLRLLAASVLILPLSYLLLLAGASLSSHRELFGITIMVLLGLGYGTSNCLNSTVFIEVVDKEYLGAASGLLASVMNILPTVVPPLVAYSVGRGEGEGSRYLQVLALIGILSTACYFAASTIVADLTSETSFELVKIRDEEETLSISSSEEMNTLDGKYKIIDSEDNDNDDDIV